MNESSLLDSFVHSRPVKSCYVEVELGKPFNYGGQAVLEGVMMRGSKAVAVAVRDPQGHIVVHSELLDARVYGGPIAKLPFLRGLTMLWDSLVLGMRSLMYSADVAVGNVSAGATAAQLVAGSTPGVPGTASDERPRAFEGPVMYGMLLFSFAFG